MLECPIVKPDPLWFFIIQTLKLGDEWFEKNKIVLIFFMVIGALFIINMITAEYILNHIDGYDRFGFCIIILVILVAIIWLSKIFIIHNNED